MRKKIFISILIFILFGVLVYLYAMFIGAKGFKIKEYKIESSTISSDYNGLKIAHISDIQYGNRSVTKDDLEKIVNKINSLKPDIIVLTGDLLDGNIDSNKYSDLTKTLSKLNASTGKYAIDGNHDKAFKKWNTLIEDCGFTNLNDSYDVVYDNSYDSIFIAGISNNTYTTKNIKDKSEVIFDYLNSPDYKSTYSILLMHEPDYIDDIDYSKFNIVMAGHSHNGQVRIPFIGAVILPEGAKKYYKEHYLLKNTDLYISSGIGTSNLPIRLFDKPSANFYRIVKKD
jgi:predicted MPP superfamily phosphohydrolase